MLCQVTEPMYMSDGTLVRYGMNHPEVIINMHGLVPELRAVVIVSLALINVPDAMHAMIARNAFVVNVVNSSLAQVRVGTVKTRAPVDVVIV